MQVKVRSQRRLKLPEMEGVVARWYTGLRSSGPQLEAYRKQAPTLTAGLEAGADVLEVAPGPGYLAIEVARLGFHVTGVDISRTFVEIASDHARRAGVTVDFRQGDAANLPLESESFDLVVCQAAFKNFRQPVIALDEMHRVLRTGATAVIQDMSGEASHADIEREVNEMELGLLNAFMTKGTLEMLRRRAYSRAQFERLAAESAFQGCEIKAEGMSVEVRLKKT
jgi:ubiquinone/menaquinone biosynthesis C-methylase UbiE